MLFDFESLRRARVQLRINPAGLVVIAAAMVAVATILWLFADGMARSAM